MFLQEFHVVNQSGETIRITPVGIMEGRDTGERGILPQYMSKIPALPSIKSQNLTLHPGEKRRFIYDWDDTQFSEVLVINEKNETFQLVVDANPTQHLYSPIGKLQIVIPKLSGLKPASGQVLAAANSPDRALKLWFLIALGFVSLFLIRPLWKACKAL